MLVSLLALELRTPNSWSIAHSNRQWFTNKTKKKEGTQKEVGRPARSSKCLLHNERNTHNMGNAALKEERHVSKFLSHINE